MSDRQLLVGGLAAALLGVVLMWAAPGVDPHWFARHHGLDVVGAVSGSRPSSLEGAATVEVRAREFSFTPDRLDVEPARPVVVVLVNAGRLFHDLVVDGTDFRLAAAPGDRAAGVLGPLEPGEYRFECTVPGHAEAGMRAVISVAAA